MCGANVKDTVRLTDIVKDEGRRAKGPSKARKASPRLSDLVRKGAKSSAEAAVIQAPPPHRQRDVVRKDGPASPAVHDGVVPTDGRLERTALPQKESFIKRAVIDKHLDAPEQALQKAVDIMGEILRAVKAHAPFSISSVEEAAELLLENLQASDDLMIHFFSTGGPSLDPAIKAVNVCIAAVKLGLELGYSPEELRRLSLTALLHDVGMARLPEGLVEKEGPLNPVERATLGRHPEEGAHVIKGLGHKYTWLADVILQVHERLDGSGYPQVLKGAEIHEFAQVVGLADVYESLVHHRPYRPRLNPLEALKEVLHRERTAFSDKILKSLIQALSPYPVGSLVRLNTGEIGRVVTKNKDRPLRPVVAVLIRGGKRVEEPAVIDLSQSPLLNIQESVVGEELA